LATLHAKNYQNRPIFQGVIYKITVAGFFETQRIKIVQKPKETTKSRVERWNSYTGPSVTWASFHATKADTPSLGQARATSFI